jgi:hypothetical protein
MSQLRLEPSTSRTETWSLTSRLTSSVWTAFNFVRYLTKLSVRRLYNVDDSMINGCEAVGGMRIGRGKQSTRRKHAPVLDGVVMGL